MVCCIPQPDCPPGLVSETPQDPDKEYDGATSEIGCVEPLTDSSKPESSFTQKTKSLTEVKIEGELTRPWMIYIVIGCTVTILLFALCVGSVVVIETIYFMPKTVAKTYKV